jgi:hypothetical protein
MLILSPDIAMLITHRLSLCGMTSAYHHLRSGGGREVGVGYEECLDYQHAHRFDCHGQS